jgi:hypothetical protein
MSFTDKSYIVFYTALQQILIWLMIISYAL